MNTAKTAWLACFALVQLAIRPPAAARDGFADPDVIQTFLNQTFSSTNHGMVVGLLDENGSRIFSAGKLDNGTDAKVNGDTVFEIGSCTKVFTALLALDMARRGEVAMDDPVAKYLPKRVKVPAFAGHSITLRHLAAQESGLPFHPDDIEKILDWASGKPRLKEFKAAAEAYTAEDLYAFLGRHTLTNAPGDRFQYSNVGMALLGHALALKAGENYESLVVNRIARPLKMDSTGITLTTGQRRRLARGHWADGTLADSVHFQVMEPAGSLLATANDLLKFLSATLGFTQSDLHPAMEEMQVVRHRGAPTFGTTAMPWWDGGVYQPPASELLGHGGGGLGYLAFIGFDRAKRRGVVVMSNQLAVNPTGVGWAILQGMPLSRLNVAILVREVVGLGVAVDTDQPTGLLRITTVFPESPAGRAGLSAGLLFKTINGVSVKGKSLKECLNLIGGKAGTKARCEIYDPESKETKVIELTRQKFVTTTG